MTDESMGASSEANGISPRLQNIALGVFAIFGFISSLVTIWSWIASTQSSLSAVINPTNLEMPASLQISRAVHDQAEIDYALSSVKSHFCDPVSVSFSGEKFRNANYSDEKCKNYSIIFSKLNKIIELDGKKLIAWDVEIKNDGRDVAENIKLKSSIPVNIEIADQYDDPLEFKASSSRKAFDLPSLNPNDIMRVRVVSEAARDNVDVEAPKISYNGGQVASREYIKISGRYSGIVGFLDKIPTIAQLIVIFIASFFITLIWLVPYGLIMDFLEKKKN